MEDEEKKFPRAAGTQNILIRLRHVHGIIFCIILCIYISITTLRAIVCCSSESMYKSYYIMCEIRAEGEVPLSYIYDNNTINSRKHNLHYDITTS